MGYNIADVSGNGTGGPTNWTFTGDLSTNPSLTTISGDFNSGFNTNNPTGEASGGYTFSALSTTTYGSLSYNTTNGTWAFTIDKSALFASHSDQTVSFTVTGTQAFFSNTDTVNIKLLICVARGTLILTPEGPVPVEALEAGDLVTTADGRQEALRWIGSRRVSAGELSADPALRPILIPRDALGDGVPGRDLLVSPQHRVLVSGWRSELFFGEREVLVPAKALVNDRDIRTGDWSAGVEYFHLLLDRHEIILTEGAPTESFHPGRYTISALGAAVQAELELHLRGDEGERALARPALSVREAAILAGRRVA